MTHPDPIDAVPSPEVVRFLLADLTRRREILRGLLRVSVHKANLPAPKPPTPAEIESGLARD